VFSYELFICDENYLLCSLITSTNNQAGDYNTQCMVATGFTVTKPPLSLISAYKVRWFLTTIIIPWLRTVHKAITIIGSAMPMNVLFNIQQVW